MSSTRIALVAVALPVIAWFALAAHRGHAVARAEGIVSAPTTPAAQVEQAAERLRASTWLNPDRNVDLLLGQMLLRQGHKASAAALFARVAREEPENVDAWAAVGQTTTDPALRALAIRRVRALEPLPSGPG